MISSGRKDEKHGHNKGIEKVASSGRGLWREGRVVGPR